MKQYLIKIQSTNTATIVDEKYIKDNYHISTKNNEGRYLIEYLQNAKIGERFNDNILRVD